MSKAKGKKGLAFTIRELENLADTVEEIVPIGHTEWDRVRDLHSKVFPEQNRTTDSLRRKFQWMAKLKMPTGDPNMPRHIRVAKIANYAIVKATDGSTGSPGYDLAIDDDDEGEGEEEGAEGDSLEDGSDEEGDGGVVVVDPASNLFDNFNEFGDDVDSCGGGGVVTTATTTAKATASTEASTVTRMSTGGGGKRSGASTGGGEEEEKQRI